MEPTIISAEEREKLEKEVVDRHSLMQASVEKQLLKNGDIRCYTNIEIDKSMSLAASYEALKSIIYSYVEACTLMNKYNDEKFDLEQFKNKLTVDLQLLNLQV